MPQTAPPHRFLPVLLLLFVGSGCAALIYEIVWLQMLQLVIGSTAVSLGVLLGTFMGGMCLGSLLLPRFVSRDIHPLRVYAYLELGIGALALLVLLGLPALESLYTFFGTGTTGVMLRGVVSGVCLLLPTLLMGATLPAIARWVETTPRGVSWLGFFYGGNIVGAVVGCLLAGFYLLRVYDMAIATFFAVAVNIGVASLALFLAKRAPHEAPAEDVEKEEAPAEQAAGPGFVYIAIGLSGMCALGAEVVWTRLISLLLGGTVYTFSIILAMFLLGLGIGSAVGAALARSSVSPRALLGACQLLAAAAIAWTAYMVSESLPNWPVEPTIAASPWFTFQLDLARTLWAVLPAAILWGASFPLALASVATKGQDPGRLVARVYAANTVGAIFGSVGASIFIIPMIGTHDTQRLLMVASLISAVLVLAPILRGSTAEAGKPLRYVGVGAALLIGVWLVVATSRVSWGMIAYGRFMAAYSEDLAPGDPGTGATWVPTPEAEVPGGGYAQPNEYAIYVGEGMNVSVAVTKTREGILSFHGGGKIQASNDPADMRLQRMLGHIPALAHPNPKTVLVVACGAGVTAGSFIPHPGVEEIIICDIEPLVPQFVTPYFGPDNHYVVALENRKPNGPVEVVYDDGRHYIRTTDKTFDIITSDPIDPWVKGCAALNTVEYYEMCRAKLNPGGIMALWMPLYESNPKTLKSVIATFFQVFPEAILWTNDLDGEGYDAVLFAQLGGTTIDVDQLQERLNRPDHAAVKQSLADVGFLSVADLLATYAGQASQMKGWSDGAEINTDRNLRLQYLAGLSLNSYMGKELLEGVLEYYQFPDNIIVGTESSLPPVVRALEAAGRRE